MEPEFNLLDEKWIRVRKEDCTVEELSLKEVFCHAHTCADLAGETPAQDVAMLRLLLAILHCVFSRVDEEGAESPLEEKSEVYPRWKALWDMGYFPKRPIAEYLEKWRDRFWLFHETRPFWQVPQAAAGTEYDVSKLNGEISESSNKLRLFSNRGGKEKLSLTYGEAARWLLYINGYDDTSAKPKKKGLESPGAGWLGKLGIIIAAGQNLFETLLLNFTLLADGSSLWDAQNLAIWERETAPWEERTPIGCPDNQAALLTLQSRRLLLHRNTDKAIDGLCLLGGDFFSKEAALTEQMTVWGRTSDKKNVTYQPKRHRPGTQMWREFGAVFCAAEGSHLPGVVTWKRYLSKKKKKTERPYCIFKIISVQYGDKDFFVNDSFDDSLTFAAGMLGDFDEDANTVWGIRVKEEVEKCEKLSRIVGDFAKDLLIAQGGSTERSSAFQDAKEECFARLDLPFRNWLYSIDPESRDKEMEDTILSWQEEAKKLVLELGKRMFENTDISAFVGREKEKEKIYYSSPAAYEKMRRKVYGVYR